MLMPVCRRRHAMPMLTSQLLIIDHWPFIFRRHDAAVVFADYYWRRHAVDISMLMPPPCHADIAAVSLMPRR
jgi:hypothetical protein